MSGTGGAASAGLSARARVVIAAGLVGLLLGFLWGVADVPRYTAAATVLVTSGDGAPAERTELEAAVEVASGAKVADRAAGLLGGDVAGADLLSEIEATAEPRAGAVRIEATADAPDFAAAAANGYAEALVEVGGKHYSAGAAASIPDAPSENRSAFGWSLIGLLAGLLAGVAAVAIAARRSGAAAGRRVVGPAVPPEPEPSFRLPERGTDAEPAAAPEPAHPEPAPAPAAAGPRPEPDATRDPGLAAPRVLARIADPDRLFGGDRGGVTIDADDAHSLAGLAAELRLADPGQAPRRLAILEPAAGEGALAVVIGLAAAAAELGRRTIVVEADLTEPALARRLGVAPTPGLRDYLRGTAGPRDVLRSAPVGDGGEGAPLVCVPAGEPGDRLPEGVGGERFAALMGRLPRAYDLVLLSGPPIDGGPDAAAIARLADGVAIVAGNEPAAAVGLPGADLLGVVLTAQSGGQDGADRAPQRVR